MLKNILTMLICLTAAVTMNAQVDPQPIIHPEATQQRDGGPQMQFETTVVDYGTIVKNADGLRTVSFTNVGDEPLVITNAKGSCGCTVPTWPKEPIMPGESSVIEVRYATNRLGKINKTIRITTNEGTQPHVLKVVGNVLDAEEEENVPKSEPNMLSGGGN